jgi:hypothetical protein
MTVTMNDGVIRLGHLLFDAYLELVAARARANTLLAQAFDLRQPRRGIQVVRIDDGEGGLAARTIKRRPETLCQRIITAPRARRVNALPGFILEGVRQRLLHFGAICGRRQPDQSSAAAPVVS